MANVFLDTNIFIDIVYRKPTSFVIDQLETCTPFISLLSVANYCYIFRIKLPDTILEKQLKEFSLVDVTSDILLRSLTSPTKDLEDNIQLHSAVVAECNIFLTEDKHLLSLKYFGAMKIADSL